MPNLKAKAKQAKLPKYVICPLPFASFNFPFEQFGFPGPTPEQEQQLLEDGLKAMDYAKAHNGRLPNYRSHSLSGPWELYMPNRFEKRRLRYYRIFGRKRKVPVEDIQEPSGSSGWISPLSLKP